MSTQVVLNAQLIAGPAQVSDTYFPSATKTIPFTLVQVPKQYNVETGAVLTINSAYPIYFPIDAIGSGGQVTQALTLYCRTNTTLLLTLTMINPQTAGTITSVLPLYGALLLEFPNNGYLTGLSVSGSGQFEYWASGIQ